MKKKILILENSSKFYWGGGQQMTMMIIKILKEENVDLYLADYQSEMLFPELVKEHIPAAHTIRLYGKCYKNPLTQKESKLLELLVSFMTLPINIIALLLFCKKNGLTPQNTTIYCVTKKVLLIAYFFSLIAKFKYIYHSHMLISISGWGGWFLKKELNNAKHVICVSKTVLSSVPTENKILLYNALDEHRKIFHKRSKKFVASVVGSIVPIKGFDIFVDSYKYLSNRNIEYRIYGTGYQEEQIKNQIGNTESISLMGFRKDIIKELVDTDVLVIPSLIKESFSLVVLQSFMLGIPCIATNIGGQAENIIDGINGFLIPINDPKSIAEKIDLLYENPVLYDIISQESRKKYNQFSYTSFRRQIINIFSNL